MTAKMFHFILTIALLIVLCINPFNVQQALADGETPPEPPAPTPVEVTPEPADADLTPTQIPEALPELPAGTEVVVLDAAGESLPLVTQEAAEIVDVTDPMWCPAGIQPGGTGCSSAYATIAELITDMVSNTSSYTQHGIIYFTATAAEPFTLTDTSLGSGVFDALNDYNLTLQGGWNGNTTTPVISGQTNFAGNAISIGTAGNPWVGNVALEDFRFDGTSTQAPMTVYTTSGDIALNNVDVFNQKNNANTALLHSASGDILVGDGSYLDGDSATESQGFSATTGTGTIDIRDTTFTGSRKTGGTADGATLSAPVVTLNNVIASNNDGDAITILNANLVTLNNVTAWYSGSDVAPAGLPGNDGSGVFVSGNPGLRLIINGGIFRNNAEYGVEVANPATAGIYILADPTCIDNVSNVVGLGCYNDQTVFEDSPPVITPSITGTPGAGGWYVSDVTVDWDVADAQSGIFSSSGCSVSNLTSDTGGTTLTCSATNNAGLSSTASVTIKIDKPDPTPVPTPVPTLAPVVPIDQGESASTGSFRPLDCNRVFWASGIRVALLNLCDSQETVRGVEAGSLPAELPAGFTFVAGLELNLLAAGQSMTALPSGASIQIDFPVSGGADRQYAVVRWDGSQWTELAVEVGADWASLTTDKTGIFVLVSK